MVINTEKPRYKPHSGQRIIHESGAKQKWLEAARRWGKGRTGLGELEQAYLDWIDLFLKGKRDGALVPHFHAWVVAPNYNQARQPWHEILEFLPSEWIKDYSQSDGMITLYGPSERAWGLIEIKSAHDPDGLQTVGLDYLWVSESQDISDEAFLKLLPTLRSPGRMGRALFEGIPSMWPDHWFRRGCMAAVRRNNVNHRYFHFTVYQNPLLSEDEQKEVEGDKEFMTEAAWRRMYLAEFSLNAGFFKNIDGCISGDILTQPISGAVYVAGLDIGISQDATILTVMDSTQRRIVNRFRWDSTPWSSMRDSIIRLNEEWGFSRVLCDTSNMGGIMAYQELSEANVSVEEFKFQGENRQRILGNIQVAIERATVSFPHIDTLIRELRSFQFIRMSNGLYKVQAPQGEFDDEVMAFALALWVCDEAVPVTMQGTLPIGRYMPTQDEADGAGLSNSLGVRMMKERKTQRMRERWEKSGLELPV